MDWLNETWFEAPVFVILISGAIAAAYKIGPQLWAVMKALVKLSEMHHALCKVLPIMEDLATEFPRNGTSAVDRIITLEQGVITLERGQDEIRDDVKEVKNLVREHIVSLQPGGQRHNDPK